MQYLNLMLLVFPIFFIVLLSLGIGMPAELICKFTNLITKFKPDLLNLQHEDGIRDTEPMTGDINPVEMMERCGVKATSNRIIVLRSLLASERPLSLIELETDLQTLDRSSILRVLTLLREHDIVHMMEDGRGVSKYEVCGGHGHCSISDMHVHFYCEKCEKTFCFEDCKIPAIDIPDGFDIHFANFMLKGICPDCKA